MTLLDRLPARGDLLVAGTGMVLTLGATLAVQRNGAEETFALMLGTAAFAAFVAGFAFMPWVFVPVAIGYFAMLPTLETFVFPSGFGGTKDLITLAAATAALGLGLRRRNIRLDLGTTVPIGLVVGLYLVNIGGGLTGETGHGVAWFHGVRLFAEPLILFVYGSSARNPHKTLRWSIFALLAACLVNVFFGLVQQGLGVGGLLDAGYTYGEEVRVISGHVRSFGTVGEPFSYAGLLLLGLAATLLWYHRSTLLVLAVAVLGIGLLISYVRTAALIALALIALAAARLGHSSYAIIIMLAAVAGAATAFAISSERKATRSVQVNSTTYLTLNGRTNIWKSTLNSPADWIFGRGVGATGTASQRATRGLTSSSSTQAKGGTIVDSSYFTVIADIGVVGVGLLIAFFVRLFEKARAAARRGERSGWLAMGLLTVTTLDALTRESFTGFPTAYIALLMIGVAWAAWTEPPEAFASTRR
jgi:hypothetical protein